MRHWVEAEHIFMQPSIISMSQIPHESLGAHWSTAFLRILVRSWLPLKPCALVFVRHLWLLFFIVGG